MNYCVKAGTRLLTSRYNCVAFLALLSLSFAGCSERPHSFVRAAERAEQQAKRAYESNNVEEADLAAARAELALSDLEQYVAAKSMPAAEKAPLLSQTRVAAASARDYAQLSHEQLLQRRTLGTIKAKAYQRLRGLVCSYTTAGLAAAAERLARADTNVPSAAEQELGAIAWKTFQVVTAKLQSTNEPPDWPGAAHALRLWSTNPPPTLGMALALAYAAGGLTDFALCEIETVHPSKLDSTNAQSLYHIERGGLFALHGWDRSAARELSQAVALAPNGWKTPEATKAVALVHFWLAEQCLKRAHYLQANLEIAEVTKAWPDTPLITLVASDRMAAMGQWAKAAEMLDERAQTLKDTWMAACLARRASEIRKNKGPGAPLSDVSLLLEIATHEAGDSAAARNVLAWLEDAKVLSAQAAERLSHLMASD